MTLSRLVLMAFLGTAGGAAISSDTFAQSATPAPAASGPGLQIQRLQSGFVVAPDARFTEVNGRQATLAGGYAGWLTDRTLFVGAGGYLLVNRDDNFKMQYGGGLVRWTFFSERAVAISTGLLAGLGDATLARPYGEIFGTPPTTTARSGGRGQTSAIRFGGATPSTADTPVRINDHFVVAEPQLNAVWTVTPWLSLDAGVGYRFIGATDVLGDELRGPSGSIAVRFGGK